MPILHFVTAWPNVLFPEVARSNQYCVADAGVLSLILLTGIVKRRWLADFVHRVGVEVTPDVFVHVVAGFVFSCTAAWLN